MAKFTSHKQKYIDNINDTTKTYKDSIFPLLLHTYIFTQKRADHFTITYTIHIQPSVIVQLILIYLLYQAVKKRVSSLLNLENKY